MSGNTVGAQQQGADATTHRWLSLSRTLVFITNGPDVLLMKRGAHKRVFPGLYNGLGGHLERGEDAYTGAIREIYEESGLVVQNVMLRGVNTIDAGGTTGITLFVFTAESLSRTVTECEEGTLHWVPIGSVQDLPLVEDLPILLPRLFGSDTASQNTLFFAHIRYDANDHLLMTFAEPI